MSLKNQNYSFRQELKRKLTSLLEKVDSTLVTCHQKLRLYKLVVCPRLTWDLAIHNFPTTFLERELMPIATKLLKKWYGLAQHADPKTLFLPTSVGGLELSYLPTIYKKLQCVKATSAMTSEDAMVRFIATQETKEEAAMKRSMFKPFTEVVNCMINDPGAPRKALKSKVRRVLENRDNEDRKNHTKDLSTQGQFYRSIENTPLSTWVNAITKLPDKVFSFIQNATKDTLPHNANLNLWKKKTSRRYQLCSEAQTLHHVLNKCEYALKMRRFN